MMSIDQNQTRRARVILADDNKNMRDIVVQLLGHEFEVVATVADGRALVEAVNDLKPEIGIIDISMPIKNGIQAAVEIKKQGSSIKIIFLTVNEDADFVRAAFETGASAYVIKRQMASDLPIAMKETLAGRTYISPGCNLPKNP